METGKKRTGLIVAVIILAVLVVSLSGYIVYDKFINTTKEEPKKETKTDVSDSTETTISNMTEEIKKLGESIGAYTVYRGKTSEGEYTLTLFSLGDKNNGFFSLVEATSMSYNTVAGGYYSIKDSYIEFYQNMSNEQEKGSFARAFSMQTSDLYQDSTALAEGYSYQYRLKLNYTAEKISNNNIEFTKINLSSEE